MYMKALWKSIKSNITIKLYYECLCRRENISLVLIDLNAFTWGDLKLQVYEESPVSFIHL